MAEWVVLRHRQVPQLDSLKVYRANGGFRAFRAAVESKAPEEVIQIVKDSGLRGRGGAGFPTGVKWSFLTPGVFPRYVVANADESEPGTFKDREIMEQNPFQFLEGIAICAFAAQANVAYIYCRGEFWDLTAELDRKIEELEQSGLLGEGLFGTEYSLKIHTHLGAGAYICGEETALLESLEGKLGQPRLRPPFPAAEGLYGKPTVVNNVETLANLPPILEKGAAWYRSIGTEKSPGTKVFSLSGHVERPGNYELPLGTSFRELIFEHAGGIPGGKRIKAVLPAGASAPILPATEEVLDTGMDYESVAAVGSALVGAVGALYAYYSGLINPSVYSLVAVDIAVLITLLLGGLGSRLGPVVGGAAFTIVEELVRPFGQLNVLVYGALLIVLFVAFRDGLVAVPGRAAAALLALRRAGG